MRAAIMMLAERETGQDVCSFAEQLLTEISAAFGHSFSLLQGTLDADGPDDATVDGCRSGKAVFLSDAECAGADALYDALNLPLRIRSFTLPTALSGTTPVRMCVGTVLSLDRDTLASAMANAFHFAQDQELPLAHIAPTGSSKSDWDQAVQCQQRISPRVASTPLSAPDAIQAMITAPEKMGLLLCPPYAGSILLSAGSSLCPHPAMIHEMVFDDSLAVYAPCLPASAAGHEPQPLGIACAISRMLKCSLGLVREAGCLNAAMENVLAAGWHTRATQAGGISAQGMVELICEQIAVAGELMRKGRFGM